MIILNFIKVNYGLLIAFSGVLGLIIGSFLNVVIYRLPMSLNYTKNAPPTAGSKLGLLMPFSHCPKCKARLCWWQKIPLISYLVLKGKYDNCKKSITWHYPFVEILSALITMFVVNYFGFDIKTLPVLILSWMLIAAAFIDYEHQLLPDCLTLSLLWLGLLLNSFNIFTSPQNAIVGAAAGYLSFWSIAKVFKLLRKIEGLGHGDFKLLAAFGAWLGWQFLPLITLLASACGVGVSLMLILCKKHQFNKPLPFGPYLAVAGWLMFFFGQIDISLLR
jgi:leader peptidase (prepilin peptidase) / N-methyltransferase